jgi:uncharacterized protein GlcG (DUF336 family)
LQADDARTAHATIPRLGQKAPRPQPRPTAQPNQCKFKRDKGQGGVEVSQEKAKTSALFRRPTKAFEDILAMGGVNLKLLKLPGALPIEGGLPIIHDGKVIGAIGVSGVKSVEDAQVAAAGLAALKAAD